MLRPAADARQPYFSQQTTATSAELESGSLERREGGRACRIRRTQNHHKPYHFDPSFANNIFPYLSIPTFINGNEFLVLENVWLAPKGLREARREEVLLRHSNLIDLYRCSSSSSRPQPILNDEGDGKGVDFKMLVISWVNFVFIN